MLSYFELYKCGDYSRTVARMIAVGSGQVFKGMLLVGRNAVMSFFLGRGWGRGPIPILV